jgi:hypothetical protein
LLCLFVRGEHISQPDFPSLLNCFFNMQTAWLAAFAGTALARNVPQLFSRDVASYYYLGCYQDSVGKRTLKYPSNRDYSTQTVETCTSWCATNKYSYCVSTTKRKELHEHEFNHLSRALNMVPNAMATSACRMGLQRQSQTAPCHAPATRPRFAEMEIDSVSTLAVW